MPCFLHCCEEEMRRGGGALSTAHGQAQSAVGALRGGHRKTELTWDKGPLHLSRLRPEDLSSSLPAQSHSCSTSRALLGTV